MAFRGANSAGGLPGSMAFNSIPGSRQGGTGGTGGGIGGAMPGFPSLSQGRPLSGQPGAGSFMGVGRGAGGAMGSFGINGLGSEPVLLTSSSVRRVLMDLFLLLQASVPGRMCRQHHHSSRARRLWIRQTSRH